MFNNHLMKACLAAVFAIGLAACSSSSDTATAPDPDPEPAPDPAMVCTDAGGEWNADTEMCTSAEDLAAARAEMQRTAINNAIMAANTAVTGLTDDASDSAISAAEMAVAAAKTAVDDAADVSDTEKAAFNTAISTIEGTLNTKKTSIADARSDAADKMMEANAALGKAMHAALGPPDTVVGTTGALANIDLSTPDTDLSDGLSIDATDGAGALSGDDSDPDAVVLEAGASAGSLGSWMGMDYAHSAGTGNSRVTNNARVYTNQGSGEREPFGDVYEVLDTVGNEGYIAVDGAADDEVARVMASVFTHSGTLNHPIPGRSDAFYVRGTYDGAPGEYRCTGTCTSTNDGTGSPSALAGAWHFKPDSGAMVHQSDANYLYFGWWVSKDSDGDPTAASAFTGMNGTIAALVDDPVSDVTGSATYAGKAAGKFAMSNPLDGTGSAGHFTADAALTAKFGSNDAPNNGGVSGTIDNFRLNDGSEDPGWSVTLNRAGWGTDGAFTSSADRTNAVADGTVWSINDNSAGETGSWSGQMYDELPGNADADPAGDGSNIPTTVTGMFYSEFSSIGRMVGAFGADKE